MKYKIQITEKDTRIFSAYADDDTLKDVAEDAVASIPLASIAFHFFNNVDIGNIKSKTIEYLLWEMSTYLSTKIESMPSKRYPISYRDITGTMRVTVSNVIFEGGKKDEP